MFNFAPESRYMIAPAVLETDGRVWVGPSEPFAYVDRTDTKIHLVRTGESLWEIAARYYEGLVARPEDLWWAIADFQPDPIIDPTVLLVEGTVLLIPSAAVVLGEVLDVSRLRVQET